MIQIFGALVAFGAVLFLVIGIASRRSALAALSEDIGYNVHKRSVEAAKLPLYDRLLQELALAGLNLSVSEVFWLWLVGSGLLAVIITLGGHLGALGVVLAPLIVAGGAWFAVRLFQARRTIKIERQLIRALVILSSMLTAAGTTISRAIGEAAQRTPAPLGPELQHVADRVAANANLGDALREVGGRINSPEWQLLTTAVILQEKHGGDLPKMIKKVVDTMSARVQNRGEARSLLAEAQMAKLFLTAATPAMIGLLALFDPQQVHELFSTDLWMLGVSALLWLCGAAVTSWMVRSIEY